MQIRGSRQPAPTRWSGAVLGALIATGCGGGGDVEAELQARIDAGDFDEVLAQVEVLERAGETDPFLDFAEGYALLHQGADAAAEAPLDRVRRERPDLGPRIATVYAEAARQDEAGGWEERARRRMARAVLFDPNVDPGSLRAPVADWFYRSERDYAAALPHYEVLYRELPEPVDRHPEWVYRYGQCLQSADRIDEALEIYADFERRFPSERDFMRAVKLRQMKIWIDQAEARLETADPDGALEVLAGCLESGWHMDLKQRARLVAGRAEEARGDLEAARRWYALVVESGNEFGGDVVRRADERLRELGEMGVH